MFATDSGVCGELRMCRNTVNEGDAVCKSFLSIIAAECVSVKPMT